METDYIGKATFTEVYRFLKDKPNGELFQAFKSLFGVGLLFFPALMCQDVGMITDIATGATLAGAGVGTIIGKAAKYTVSLFWNQEHKDYAARYDQMQMAQVMLVYASYFDTISQYLPDENGEIILSSGDRRKISQNGFQAYLKKLEKSAQRNKNMPKLLEHEIALPNPAREFSQYKEELKKFYEALNIEFIKFFEECSFWKEITVSADSIDGAQKKFFLNLLEKLPENALCTYEKQYFELSKEFPEFAVWANHAEHVRMETQLDIGFQNIAKEMEQLRKCLSGRENETAETLSHYQKKYENYVKTAVIEGKENDFAGDIIFPAKKEIFVPQSFQALTYHGALQLEKSDAWKGAFLGEDIGRYIRSVLQHPKYGEFPMLILGLPGAGKTLLCHMLAAQILSAEYYVIIIRLRDAIAENTIIKQIDAQIERDFGDDCTWNDLRRNIKDKPFLLIFDGYDELLQASGKTHSDYLNKIAEFQADHRSYYHSMVRCIVTSRETLIDKAAIPAGCPVLRLCEFDEERIGAWCRIWNQANEQYFVNHYVDRLEIASAGKVRELAGQPLLLLMLALYEMNGNRLQEQGDISRAKLYDKLIQDFVIREKEKDAKFRQLPQKKKDEEVRKGFHYLGMAALGMYNRKQLYIRTTDLNRDMNFLTKEDGFAIDAEENALEAGEKLVGSFFFIHSSKSTAKKNGRDTQTAAYEFLHNTFGEFLTAHFILELAFGLIQRQLRDEDLDENFIWTETLKKKWHISLAYTPLFTRPVVLHMIHEMSDIMARERGIDSEKVQEALDILFRHEIGQIIKGNAFSKIDSTLKMQGNPLEHPELMLHMAAYSMNLVLLRVTICSDSVDFTESLGTAEDWRKLTHMWRYAFSEEELVGMSCLLGLERTEKPYRLVYQYDEEAANRTASFSKLDRMCRVANILGEDAEYAVFSAYLYPMNPRICKVIEQEELQVETQYALKETMQCILSTELKGEKLTNALLFLQMSCEKDKDAAGFYLYCTLVRAMIEQHTLDKACILKLMNSAIFQITNHVIRGQIHERRWIFLNLIFQEIFKCVYVLPESEKIRLLREFTEYYSYEIRNLPHRIWHLRYIIRSMKYIMFSYCKMMQSVIKRSQKEEFGRIFYEFIREVSHEEMIFQILSEKELAEIFWTCLAIKKATGSAYGEDVFLFLIQGISFANMHYRSEELKSSFFRPIIECFYSASQKTKYGVRLQYSENLKTYFKKTNMARLLLPAYEQTFYHFLYLVCDLYEISGEILYFDWIAELVSAVKKYGCQMSLQTLKIIAKYAQMTQSQKLCLEIKNVLQPLAPGQ